MFKVCLCHHLSTLRTKHLIPCLRYPYAYLIIHMLACTWCLGLGMRLGSFILILFSIHVGEDLNWVHWRIENKALR